MDAFATSNLKGRAILTSGQAKLQIDFNLVVTPRMVRQNY